MPVACEIYFLADASRAVVYCLGQGGLPSWGASMVSRKWHHLM